MESNWLIRVPTVFPLEAFLKFRWQVAQYPALSKPMMARSLSISFLIRRTSISWIQLTKTFDEHPSNNFRPPRLFPCHPTTTPGCDSKEFITLFKGCEHLLDIATSPYLCEMKNHVAFTTKSR